MTSSHKQAAHAYPSGGRVSPCPRAIQFTSAKDKLFALIRAGYFLPAFREVMQNLMHKAS